MDSLIKSITIENYRGFAKKQTLELTDFNNIVFLVGQNNTGKSLITRLFSIFGNSRCISDLTNFSDNDFFDLQTDKPIEFVFELNKDFLVKNSELKQLIKFNNVLLGCLIHKEKSKAYRRYCYLQTNDIKSHTFESNTIYSHATFEYNSTFGQKVDIKEKDKTEQLIEKIIYVLTNSFLVFEPIRAFDKEQQNSYFKTGKELINWINDRSESDVVLKVKRKIKEYFIELNLESPEDVNTDDDNKLFVFTFGDIKLTSNEIGTGYSMLYILLMELLRNKNKHIVIIDEIESHLQPGLIRVLIRILRNIGFEGIQRKAQYILATHSPTVLESAKEDDFLYRFQKHSKICTFYKFFRTKKDLSEMRKACNDLGVVPGDALLSNIVVWVEGPSEILWLRALLKIYLPKYLSNKSKSYNIIEGLHYSILMTGGGLIANLSFDEKAYDITDVLTSNLLKVLRINPNPFVIIDFDAVVPTSEKYKRGLRIANEINNNNKNKIGNVLTFLNPNVNNLLSKPETENVKNFWWLKARELENYCPPDLLKQFYKKYHESSQSKVKGWDKVSDWNVYDSIKGSGTLLEERGLENVKDKSGTIIHKQELALFIADNLQSANLEVSTNYPNQDQLNDLILNLDKLIDYISQINDLM